MPTPADTGGDTGGTDASYADGTYTADGSYQAPSGTESITVELTLADDIVTDVTVTPHATDPTAKGMQANFAGGIADQVVGQDIDTAQRDPGLRIVSHERRVQDRRSRRSRQTRWPEACRFQAVWTFEAIGAPWRIDTPDDLSDSQREAVAERIEAFDRDWSRFRADSLVIAHRPQARTPPPARRRRSAAGLVPRALRRDRRSRLPAGRAHARVARLRRRLPPDARRRARRGPELGGCDGLGRRVPRDRAAGAARCRRGRQGIPRRPDQRPAGRTRRRHARRRRERRPPRARRRVRADRARASRRPHEGDRSRRAARGRALRKRLQPAQLGRRAPPRDRRGDRHPDRRT